MDDSKHVFTASRLTAGNLIFPVRIEVTPQRIARIKPKLIGSTEESMPIAKVASVSLEVGLIFGSIRIESSGGSSPIHSEGHYKGDVRVIRDLIQQFQQAGERGSGPYPANSQ